MCKVPAIPSICRKWSGGRHYSTKTYSAKPETIKTISNAAADLGHPPDARSARPGMLDNPNSVLYARKGTADLFLHITSTYKFTGYDILPDYGVFDIFKNPDIPRALEDYKRHFGKHCLSLVSLFHSEHSLTQSNSSWVGSEQPHWRSCRGISLVRFSSPAADCVCN